MTVDAGDPEELRARLSTLEHLLEVHERVALQQTQKLELARAEAVKRADEARRSEEVARRHASILDLVLRSMSDGVVVLDEGGKLLLANPAGQRYPFEPDAMGAFAGLQQLDGTPCPLEQQPLLRALQGEAVDQLELMVSDAGTADPQRAVVSVTASPVRTDDGRVAGAVAVIRDATERSRLLAALAAHNQRLERTELANAELVERLRLAVDELSTPILEVWEDVLALPVIGLVDARRAAQMMERLLDEIVRKQVGHVIIDVTGVEVIDSNTAQYFSRLVRGVELLGARCVLTGIRPAVGQTLLDLGLDLGNVRTLRNLKHALGFAIGRSGRARDGRGDLESRRGPVRRLDTEQGDDD